MEESTLSSMVVNLILMLIALASVYVLIWGSVHYKAIKVAFGFLLSFIILFFIIASNFVVESTYGQLILSAIIAAAVSVIWLPNKLGSFNFTAMNAVIVGLLLLTAMKMPPGGYLYATIVLYIMGGIISLRLKHYTAPVNTGILSALTAYHCATNAKITAYVSQLELPEGAGFSEQFQMILMPYAKDIAGLIFVIILFVIFAIYMQKRMIEGNGKKPVSKHLAYLFASTAMTGFVFALFTSYNQTGVNLFGVSLLSWPVLVIATVILLRIAGRLTPCSFGIEGSKDSTLPKEIYFAIFFIFGFVILPALTWLVVSSVDGSNVNMQFYNSFVKFHKPIWMIVKLAFSIFIFPDLLYKIVYGETFLYSQLTKILKE